MHASYCTFDRSIIEPVMKTDNRWLFVHRVTFVITAIIACTLAAFATYHSAQLSHSNGDMVVVPVVCYRCSTFTSGMSLVGVGCIANALVAAFADPARTGCRIAMQLVGLVLLASVSIASLQWTAGTITFTDGLEESCMLCVMGCITTGFTCIVSLLAWCACNPLSCRCTRAARRDTQLLLV